MTHFNPAMALVLAFVYSLGVSFSTFEWFYLLPIAYVCYLSKASCLEVFKKLLFLNLFIFVLFLVLLIQSGFQEALNVYLRANAIILFNLLLFFGSKGYDIIRGLSMLRFPHSVVSSSYFTLKMISFLTNDFKQLKATLKTRGFKANTSMFTYETMGNMVGLLFVKSIRKSERLKETFITRGFQGNIYLHDQFIVGKKDYILLGFILVMLLLKGVL